MADMPTTTQEDSPYSPTAILKHPSFRIFADDEEVPRHEAANYACFYNHKKEIHLVEKPKPSAGPGQVVVRVRATGICG
jgi:L-iditol 2-dehydrogenase